MLCRSKRGVSGVCNSGNAVKAQQLYTPDWRLVSAVAHASGKPCYLLSLSLSVTAIM